MNDRGEVTGASLSTAGVPHAFIWRAGTMTDIWSADPIPGLHTSDGRAINALGQVAGSAAGPRGFSVTNAVMLWVE